MMLALTMVVAAAPAWKVSWSSSSGTDHGNGKIVATSDVTCAVTPTEVRITAEGTTQGKRAKQKPVTKPTPPEVRDAIAALLPSLPKLGAAYSIGGHVNDEGWANETLDVQVGEKAAVHFALEQGPGGPPVPTELQQLKKLIVQAVK